MQQLSSYLAFLCVAFTSVYSLDNGLALTPPMGWLSWQRYRCNTNCKNDPNNCISEKLYMTMADKLVSEGYRDVGYQYVNIDDCWMAMERDSNGSLVADPDRFPSGIKALADYVHSKGLKLGIYEDFGTKTCGGYPGSKFYLQKDAETFASWGVDMLKLDGCYTDTADMDEGYPLMEFYLNRTGRPILYSCSWPAYIVGHSIPDYKKIAKFCNIWRNYGDIDDSWGSVKSIISFYGNDEGNFSQVAGPGNFNDPDMLIIGDYGLSYDEQRAQMALWAIMASPLFMSNDLAHVPAESKALLQNRKAIAVNQDPLGKQGTRLYTMGKVEIWSKPLSGGSFAFAFLNLQSGGYPREVSVPVTKLGSSDLQAYMITDVFSGAKMGVFKPHDMFNTTVNPSGVFFGVADIV